MTNIICCQQYNLARSLFCENIFQVLSFYISSSVISTFSESQRCFNMKDVVGMNICRKFYLWHCLDLLMYQLICLVFHTSKQSLSQGFHQPIQTYYKLLLILQELMHKNKSTWIFFSHGSNLTTNILSPSV